MELMKILFVILVVVMWSIILVIIIMNLFLVSILISYVEILVKGLIVLRVINVIV